MKTRLLVAAAVLAAAAVHLPASAQFGFKNPLASGGGSAAPANASEVLRNTRDALLAFTKSELGLSQAIGGYAEYAAQERLLDGMKTGDAAASKDDLEQIIVIHKQASAHIQQKVAENAVLDANNKALAGKSMLEYVKGLIYTRKMVGSVQDLAKNPMSLGGDMGSALLLAKEMPPVAAGAASTTGKLFTYMTTNGVDMSEAKKAADGLGT
jgi:hypothetical protein